MFKSEINVGLSPEPEIAPIARRSPLRQAARAALTAALPRRVFLVRGPARSQAVCLTFDDGPHPVHTPRLLDALKAHDIRATFFVIGRNVNDHPELVRRMVAEGHAIGGHSYDHLSPPQVSARQLIDEVRRTTALLTSLLGHPTKLFRPPHGKLTPGKFWRLWRDGQSIVLWNVDPKDFACRTADEMRARLKARPPRGGDIVLMHDNHPHAADALPDLVAAVRGQGLTFSTVLPWLGKTPSSPLDS